ncbi:SCP2 sterol-binding domain-containing protein [Anaeromyxobacter paludicola]|uniref:SCP2 domain-containing protein n=1 Tax=Anaeromyxobacter paludicola TaxID=2918171 RepID=A0ABN6N400_9BACT|nr:SCP2 sterol-binding domain-containing protein [Anaeromyxobacter paludicola]BDG07696.1 hypothetical protein AMPC_08090 [Anaeromyxobacter paludicola]
MIFPSAEWLAAAVAQVNAEPDLAKALAGLGRDLGAVVEPDPPHFRGAFAVWGRQESGRIAEARVLADPDDLLELEPEYVLRAPYRLWKELLLGRLDPVKTALSGRLRVEGDLEALVRRSGYRYVAERALARLDTEFADEARRDG